MAKQNEEYRINHLAIWILVAVNQITGFLWYSLPVFGRTWMRLWGFASGEMMEASPLRFVFSILAAALLGYVLAWLFQRLQVINWVDGLKIALLFCLSFTLLPRLVHDAFAGQTLGIAFIDVGREFVNFAIYGVVLAEWKVRRK